MSDLRTQTLEHIRRINDDTGEGARCPHAEMIAEAEAAIRDGQSEWRKDRWGVPGRWITPAGREALAKASA